MRRGPSIRSLLFALVIVSVSATSFSQIGVSITIGPPALPVYVQPPCPAEGYIWTPGYWAYDYDYGDYYWVPGTWVLAPEVGFLWTPGWWGWGGGAFIFHEGYWGPRVGFYGGIPYGYGYFGNGYEGGRWDHDRFFYNRSVNNVNVTNIHNVYNTTVINNNTTTVNRVSYNGGNGGINARPTSEEEAAAHERHIPPVAAQTQHVQAARANRELRASVNHGKPPIAATPKPGAFTDRAAVRAKKAGGPYNPPANRGVPRPESHTPGSRNNVPRPPVAAHAMDLQPHSRPAPPNTGNAKLDQKYQQQQDKLYAKQQQEHQRLQQKQEQDHQRMARQQANEARNQQMEQKHQQQTRQLEERHVQQQQHLQQRQQSGSRNQSKPR
jgi:WXXGXW repeat (2 copies)